MDSYTWNMTFTPALAPWSWRLLLTDLRLDPAKLLLPAMWEPCLGSQREAATGRSPSSACLAAQQLLWTSMEALLGADRVCVAVADNLGADSLHPTWLGSLGAHDLNQAATRVSTASGGVWAPLEVQIDDVETTLSYAATSVPAGLQVLELVVWMRVVRRLTGCPVRPIRLSGPDVPGLRGVAESVQLPWEASSSFAVSYSALDGRRPFLSEGAWRSVPLVDWVSRTGVPHSE